MGHKTQTLQLLPTASFLVIFLSSDLKKKPISKFKLILAFHNVKEILSLKHRKKFEELFDLGRNVIALNVQTGHVLC